MSLLQAPGLLQSADPALKVVGMNILSSAAGVCRSCVPQLVHEMYRGSAKATQALARICPTNDPRLDEIVSSAVSRIVLTDRFPVLPEGMLTLLLAYSGRGTLSMRSENWKAVLHLYHQDPVASREALVAHLKFHALTIVDQQLHELISSVLLGQWAVEDEENASSLPT